MKRRALIVVMTAVVVVATTGTAISGATKQRAQAAAVGVRTVTFVDSSRPTVANGAVPARSSRTLKTTIFYPATGAATTSPTAAPTTNASPALDGAPYPLIVFSHGLGSSPVAYAPLLSTWAAAGYVVAAPWFPLTSTGSAGGINPADINNQPADVRFVITSMLKVSARSDGPLSRMVNRREIAIAGHSLGGITTLAVATNTCCRDPRVDAAVIEAGGAPLSFPKGHYAYAKAPPILLVHGDADQDVPYGASVDIFNRARSPKGLLTIMGGGHGSPVDTTGPAAESVVRTTIDFFDAYLKHDGAARRRLPHDGQQGITTVHFASTPGANLTIATTPKVVRKLKATATPHRGLTNGQTVTVTWSGYTPGKTVNITECSKGTQGDAGRCDLKDGRILQPDPTGSGSLTIQIVVGTVGSGICDAKHQGCVIYVNDAGSVDPSASVQIPITLASP